MPETVGKYDSYEIAAKEACKWVEKGKVKVDPAKLEVYPRCLFFDSVPF